MEGPNDGALLPIVHFCMCVPFINFALLCVFYLLWPFCSFSNSVLGLLPIVQFFLTFSSLGSEFGVSLEEGVLGCLNRCFSVNNKAVFSSLLEHKR